MPPLCRHRRAATPTFRPSCWRKSLGRRCSPNRRAAPTSLRHAHVNLPVAHRDFHWREAHGRIAGMAAGCEIVLVAVPRADDVARFAEAQTDALLVGGDHFLDLVENLALANRTAGMRTHVLVREQLAAVAEDADFELIHRE